MPTIPNTKKTIANAMTYEKSGNKHINPDKVALKYAEQLPTLKLSWLLVKRHKVAILAGGNVVLVLNWAVPQWVVIVKSLI